MIINGNRSLAYIAKIDSVTPLEGYNRVEYAHIGGWGVVVSKADGFKSGDLCIYIETDSLCPKNDERFAFLEKRKYKVKIQKMCKVYSQGLIMPLSMFPEIKNPKEGKDVADTLGIVYYIPEDNKRKANDGPDYKGMASRHPKLFKKKPVRWLMRRTWGKKLLYVFFGKKKKKKENSKRFPTHFSYIKKTDEERIENLPHLLKYKEPLCVTEKLDGTSSTYILEKKKKGYEFYVCSRNVRMFSDTQESFHNQNGEDNIYWQSAKRYDIEARLKEYLDKNGLDYVCIQGESVGPRLQGNPLKLPELDLYCFNFIRSDIGRIPSKEGKAIVEGWGMKWVPILDEEFYMPNADESKDPLDAMEEFKLYADGKSVVNPDVLREGVVLRDDGLSFKNVSRKYLQKHQ